jgi:transcriptional regulator NrdR family protein
MAKEVIKRGGKREKFRAEKLKKSVRAACKGARIPPARAKKIVSKVSAKVLRFAKTRKAIGTAILRKKTLAALRKTEPAAAMAWLKYDKRRRARRKR